ncbi:phenylalanyl-tRNA synthetase beta subunit [Planifilum fimeticola]|uniref:Phenylalanine--tRNA ligase beta subunit n=1 Tax=Planifilum fimeticola TaxID=201975 RepID=A0A2T0LIP8_9BACL|nr:phenylalanine--tRNA ligase subunit beta [Planifilum fimeticola]PRX42310.1 phenylalanyl-tRNA synthetase beta subunit [Planifilum fimeticola]
MRVSYEWLKEMVDLSGIDADELAESLTRTGVAVDAVEDRNPGVQRVVVGRVKSVEPHPGAERLRVCRVDVGQEDLLQIVCGAPNVAEGQLVPVALEGAELPGDVRIKRAKLRGVESQGMICSAGELGLPEKLLPKELTEGILVLTEEAKVGQDIRSLLGMDDKVLELDLTPNRSDCLSMIGMAYEAGAVFDRSLRLPEPKELPVTGAELPVSVAVESEADCPVYAAQVVDGLRLGPSPQWMQNRLIAAGVRPINNIVDVTNYVMLEYGQPLHAFDYDQVSGGRILVRRARQGERLETLDGVTRECDQDTILITDGDKPLGLAGVMGGANSEVKDGTTRVLIESACFDPVLIRRTSRRLGLRSEASNRFEKGVDRSRIVPALKRAVQLLVEVAGGRVASPIVLEKSGDVDEKIIPVRHGRIVSLMGADIGEEDVMDIFRRLRFPVKKEENVYHVQVPSRRNDLNIEVDIIEEVARLYGYNRIPAVFLQGSQGRGGLTREQRLRRTIRHTLRYLGMNEAVTYSLTSPQWEKGLSLHPDARPIPLSMPISDERSVLRTSLLPHLLQSAAYNVHRRQEHVALFEIGRTYLAEKQPLTDLPEERWELAGLWTGPMGPVHWREQTASDFYRVKGILESLFARLGIEGVEFLPDRPEGFHPGRTAEIRIGGRFAGILGQIHPRLSDELDLKETFAFQLDMEVLLDAAKTDLLFRPIPRYPASTRDLAIVVDAGVPAAEVEKVIRRAAGEHLESVTLFDVYTGEQVGNEKKSLAYSLVYRAEDRTLTDEEVAKFHQAVVDELERVFGARLRT